MELKWLEDFVALSRIGSFSRAANERNVTQPAYSRRIKALEAWLGVALIDRSSFPVKLTAAGEDFLPHAQAMIADVNLFRQDLRLMHADGESAVHILTFPTLALRIVPEIVTPFAHLHPEATVTVRQTNTYHGRYFGSLTDGLSDICIMYEGAAPGLDAAELSRLDMVQVDRDLLIPVASPSLAATLADNWLEATSQPIPLLAYNSDAYVSRLLEATLAKHAGRFHIVFRSSVAELLRRIALSGAGVAWLADNMVAADLAAGTLVRLPGDDLVHEAPIAAYRLRAPRRAMAETLWDLLKDRSAQTSRDADARAGAVPRNQTKSLHCQTVPQS